MPTRHVTAAVAVAVAVAVAISLATASPASAAPGGSAQHPYTFSVTCERLGAVTVAEGGNSPVGFVEGDLAPTSLVISAQGAIYEGKLDDEPTGVTPVFSFRKDWGARTGLERDVCTRVSTEVEDGMTYTAFETFVVALLPTRR